MTKKTVRAIGGAVLATMIGLTMSACTTVVHDRPSTVVVKEKSPDVVVVPSDNQ